MDKTIKIIISLSIIILLWTGVAIGTIDNSETNTIRTLEKSEEFERWEQLSEEERNNAIQPLFCKIPFSSTVKASTYNSLLRLNANDTKYNFADSTTMTVKDQKATASCWAFAYSSVIEACIAKHNNISTTTPISPMHIDYKTANMYERQVGDRR